MNPKLKEGSILLYYPDIQERTRYIRYDRPPELYGYELSINALYVRNRRERTSGAHVPKELIPYLDMLKVRTGTYYYGSNSGYTTAVGCRTKSMYRANIGLNEDIPAAFRKAFKEVKETAVYGADFFENEFVEKFLETKLGNKDKKFLLFKPIEQIQGFVPVKDIQELADAEVWAESKKYRPRQ